MDYNSNTSKIEYFIFETFIINFNISICEKEGKHRRMKEILRSQYKINQSGNGCIMLKGEG